MNRLRQWISIVLFQLCDKGSMYEQIKTMDFYCFIPAVLSLREYV